MAESWRTRIARWQFNLFPAYRMTGAWIAYIASDWHEIHVRVPLNLLTRNYFGTIFGGSMYAAIDPVYAIMLVQILGAEYVVWDKAAAIEFKKPGRTTLTAVFRLPSGEIEAIRTAVSTGESVDRIYVVDLVDKEGVVCASARKTVYIRLKNRPTITSTHQTLAKERSSYGTHSHHG